MWSALEPQGYGAELRRADERTNLCGSYITEPNGHQDERESYCMRILVGWGRVHASKGGRRT